MKFPSIRDIATTDVIGIAIDVTVSEAIEKMLKYEHRTVIVYGKTKYYIFTVLDVLNIKEKNISLESPLGDFDLIEVSTICADKNVLDTLEYLNKSIEYICVLNNDNTLYGLVTHSDIISNIDPDTLMDNFRLEDFLKLGKRIRWVPKEDKTSDILVRMINDSFDNIIVVEDKKPIGILTTKDIMELIKNRSDLSLSVSEYMSSPVESIKKSATIKEALDFLKTKHYKRVVVVDNEGFLAGIIAQKELISLTYSRWATLMKEYQSELSELNAILEHENREYEVRASTDSLTGLYNRHKFSELYLSSYSSMAQRNGDMSLIMLDIDFFKQVNDTYGHNVGDQVLVQISHSLLKTLRNIDIVCRWGGEEFVCLLPTAVLKNAMVLAEKMRKNIEELEMDIVKSVTVSFGVSQVREGDTMEDTINRADKALYHAKESGRNCVKTELDI